MKSFIVVTDTSDGCIKVDLHQAVSLEVLARKLINFDELVSQMIADGEQVPKCTGVEMLLDLQSDGSDTIYTIKELVSATNPEGKIVNVLFDTKINQ